MIVYENAGDYIATLKTNIERVKAIELIIDSLMITALNNAGNAGTIEYSLNTGQTQIKKTFRGSEAIEKSILSMERLKNMYMSRIKGYSARLVDAKNANRRLY